jgi:hypothetical protein
MTPEERQLIAGLFERMRGFGAPEKDRDAEALIYQQIRALPDAAYMLVQSVLVQEQALQNAQGRIQELEARLEALEGAEPPRKSGGFLSGYWGQRSEPKPASVPQVGARAPSAPDSRQPWAQPSGPSAGPYSGAPAPSGGGGFMRSAISTAAGVAGGMLLADSLRGMLGGHGGSPFGSVLGPAAGQSAGLGGMSQAERDAADDAAQDAADDAADQQASQDAADDAADDADDDPGYDDGGDDSGGDMDV